MRMKPAEKENESSFAPSVEKILSHPLNLTQGGSGPARVNEKSGAVVYLKNGLPEMFQSEGMKEEFSEGVHESERHPLESFLARAEAETSESQEKGLEGTTFMSSFLVELVQTIKKSLASISHATVLGWEKGADGKSGETHAKIREEIKKIDSVLNSLLNFININTPITKSNTLSVILEDVLEASDKQLQEKNIRIVKRCEKDLPETYFHAEQVRFILHSILQYAIFLTPARGTIWVLMRSADGREGSAGREAPREKKGYVEVVIGFDGDRRPGSSTKVVEGRSRDGRETIDLILTLAREILQRNHGVMAVQTGEIKEKVLIAARFPVERRKVVYYAPITL